MKFFVVFLLLAAVAVPEVPALIAGDTAKKWNSGTTVAGLRIAWDLPRKDDKKGLTVLEFFNVYSDLSRRSVPILVDLQKRYRKDGLRVLSFASQPEIAIRQFVKEFPAINYSVLSDPRNELTALYMQGRKIFPMVYVIDEQAKIIWDGEVGDLPEMLERYYTGGFDAMKQRKVAVQLDELQRAMQSMDERSAVRASNALFALEPANAAALRLRSFMLESSGRAPEAWKLFERAAGKVLSSRAVQMLRFDFAARQEVAAGDLPRVAREMLRHVAFTPEDAALFAWRLLMNPSFNPEFIQIASAVLKKFETNSSADILASRALLAYRLGRLDQALALQKQATACAEGERKEQSENLQRYYQQLQKMQ